MQNNGDVKILGSGECGGGIYNEVKICGSGDIKGDIQCNELKILGAGDVSGNVKAKEIKISGALDIDGNIEGENVSVSGALDIKGDINCNYFKIAGAIDVDGNTKAEKIELKGAAEISGNCEAETFTSSGVFEIGGMLNAGDIIIKLKGKNTVEEIGGEKIEVIRNSDTTFGKIFKFSIAFGSGPSKLECQTIEGDDIYLEYTKAETVRGKKIVLGEGCHIENIEYSESFNMSKDSKAESIKQI
ncbi:polymer-forming cytoskeletal protein [Haloimpatiens sp. FM7315]|uniref:polymer-forming cytoskeletal protein n=1 Tax=Haloimpatiens sp. FM7315 TaxID=3298609 RepID=UPI0035A3A4C5